MTGKLSCDFENWHFFAVLADRNLFADSDFVRGNVHLAAIHLNVSVTHQLARLATRDAEAKPENDVVETAFKLFEQFFTRNALGAGRVLKVIAELPFLGEVNALCFLLFTQLQTVADDLGLFVFPVLSGSKVALFNGAFVAEALRAFQEELDAFPAT